MSNCKTKPEIFKVDLKAGEVCEISCRAYEEDTPYPMSSFAVKVELRADGSGGPVLAAWVSGDPEITFDDSIGETKLTISPEQTMTLAEETAVLMAGAGFSGVAYLDFLFTKTGDGWRSGIVQVNFLDWITTQ